MQKLTCLHLAFSDSAMIIQVFVKFQFLGRISNIGPILPYRFSGIQFQKDSELIHGFSQVLWNLFYSVSTPVYLFKINLYFIRRKRHKFSLLLCWNDYILTYICTHIYICIHHPQMTKLCQLCFFPLFFSLGGLGGGVIPCFISECFRMRLQR